MTAGMNRNTGKKLEGFAHLYQSIDDILLTKMGTVTLRRDYGSEVPGKIDSPMNKATMVDIFASVATAIDKWEPRFQLQQIDVTIAEPGHTEFRLGGLWFYNWPQPGAKFVEVVL
jgi:uncharacterized protein